MARALDYETVKEYIITVEAHDGGTPSLSSSAVVKVLVVDANDNRPVFARSNYTAVVREDVAVNTSLLQVCLSRCLLQVCLSLFIAGLSVTVFIAGLSVTVFIASLLCDTH